MSTIIEEFEAFLASEPGNAMVRYILANEYFKAGRNAQAVEQLEAYLRLQEDEGAAYRMLAQALDRLGRIDEARRAYESGIRQAMRHGHPGMAEEFREALEELPSAN
jgi:predicted Zn-dependent protease